MPALDEDDSKVMDVSKPGKGKPVGTSRPVVAPVVSEPAEDNSVSVSVPVSEPVEALRTSPGSHKTIEPLSADLQPEDKKKDDTANTESVPEDGDVSDSSDGADDAAGVDALASTTETKREAAKKAEEQAKRDAELQALIASRKYVVPISGTSGGGSKARVWGIPLVLIAIVAGGYFLADAGVFGDSVKVPFEIIKNSKAQTVADTSTAASVEEEQDKPAGQEEQKTEQESSEPAGNASVAPEVRARDGDRKNELKNLQQKLETYFNDNGEYPLSLSGLIPRPTTAELTDDRGANYSYTSNGQSYTLAAQLENTNDPDAESDGSYLLRSINE